MESLESREGEAVDKGQWGDPAGWVWTGPGSTKGMQ